MKRSIFIAAACTLSFALSSCGGTGPSDVVTNISLPEEMTESPDEQITDEQAPQSPVPDPKSLTGPQPAEVKVSAKDCVVVAAGVSSIMLAPLNFISGPDAQAVNRLKEQIESLRDKVPEELEPHFSHLEDVVESGPEGSGQFDETAVRSAMRPMEEWLQDHCGETQE